MSISYQEELAVRSKYRDAAYHAKKAFPGAIGEYLAREINSYEDWGYRIGSEALMSRLVEDVLAQPVQP